MPAKEGQLQASPSQGSRAGRAVGQLLGSWLTMPTKEAKLAPTSLLSSMSPPPRLKP